MPGARALAFIDDVAVFLPLESARDTSVITKVTLQLQECLALEDVQLNHNKSQALLTGCITLDNLTEAQL